MSEILICKRCGAQNIDSFCACSQSTNPLLRPNAPEDTELAAAKARIAELEALVVRSAKEISQSGVRIVALENGLRDAFDEGWNAAVGCDFMSLDEEMRDKDRQWLESDSCALLKEKE